MFRKEINAAIGKTYDPALENVPTWNTVVAFEDVKAWQTGTSEGWGKELCPSF